MPRLTQITRHDCVEGWSVVGKWQRRALATVLAMAQPKPEARYVVFRCFDKDETGDEYYESLDLTQAAHPQTMLALELNDAPIDPDHGAPVRLRIPTQLGYKSAKWVARIELAASNQIFPGSPAAIGKTRATSGTPGSEPARAAAAVTRASSRRTPAARRILRVRRTARVRVASRPAPRSPG